MVTCLVQYRGADWARKGEQQTEQNKTPELKIQKIEILSEIKDKLIENLIITMPLDHLDEELALEFSELVLKNKGNVNFYFSLIDNLTQSRLRLFARRHRVKVTKDFYSLLKKYQDEGFLDFEVS